MAIAEITAALGALKAASDAIGLAYSADRALSESDWKMKLVEAREAIASARIAAIEANERVGELEAEIARLTEAFDERVAVVKHEDAIYKIGEDGKPHGDGFCLRCYQVERRLHHLTYPQFNDKPSRCSVCKTEYTYFRSYPRE